MFSRWLTCVARCLTCDLCRQLFASVLLILQLGGLVYAVTQHASDPDSIRSVDIYTPVILLVSIVSTGNRRLGTAFSSLPVAIGVGDNIKSCTPRRPELLSSSSCAQPYHEPMIERRAFVFPAPSSTKYDRASAVITGRVGRGRQSRAGYACDASRPDRLTLSSG